MEKSFVRNTLPGRALLAGAAALALTALTPASPEAKPEDRGAMASAHFPWQGEELYFKVTVNGSEAAHAVVRVGKVRTLKNQPYVALSAKAKSVGLFHTIYPMDDRANTFIDPFNFQPLRSEKVFREAGKGRTYKVDYVHNLYKAKIHKTYHADDKNPEDRQRQFTRAIPSNTHTALSWFLDLRKKKGFKKGDEISYHIYDGWKLSRIDLTVVGEERVITPMGSFTATRFDFDREILRSRFNKKKVKGSKKPAEPILSVRKPAQPTGSLWLTTDPRHLPIKIQMKSTYGVGEVFLARYIGPKGR